MNYQANKARMRAALKFSKPTLTDQAGARDTDINIIVKNFTKHGIAPAVGKQPIQGVDWTEYPSDLKGMFDKAKELAGQLRKLPKQLRNMGMDELLALNADDLKRILAPAQPDKPADKEPKA